MFLTGEGVCGEHFLSYELLCYSVLFVFFNITDVHKTKNAPHPPPVKNAAVSP